MPNLVDNALRYGAPPVEITVETTSDLITITVVDHGPGIPPERLTAVLDPFDRLEPSRGRESGGAGLGLAIVHALAGAQGARLELDNSKYGGLRVRVWLPVAFDSTTKTSKSPAGAASA